MMEALRQSATWWVGAHIVFMGLGFLLGFAMGDRFGYKDGYRDGRNHRKHTR